MGIMKEGRLFARVLLLCLWGLALLCVVPAQAEEEPEAENITKAVIILKGSSEVGARYSHDGNYLTHNTYGPEDILSVRPRSPHTRMGTLYFRLGAPGAEMILRQYDGQDNLLLTSELRAEGYCYAVGLEADCCRAEITAQAEPFQLYEFMVLGQGRLPDQLPLPKPPVERTDFLIVTTHPDDEWIFLGAVYPIYAGEQGYTGTFAYVTTPNIGRLHEAINSVWAANMGTTPYFLGFPDVDRSSPQHLKDTFKADEVTMALVRLYRKIKPLVVVTQDPVNGEYGHWQHIVTAKSALEAARLASDPTCDPDSAAEFGTWTVKKVYQHLAADNPIILDVTSPLSAYGGETALQVAKRAFDQHRSQKKYIYRPSIGKNSKGDIRYFGLTYTTVGPDTGNDMFEHIGQNELAQNILSATPAPEAALTPEPTPMPTAAPTPTPMPISTPEPTALAPVPTDAPPTLAPTAVPEVTISPTQAPAAASEREGNVLWHGGAAAALLLGAAALIILRRRNRNKT